MLLQKKTLSGINKKTEALMGEYDALIAQGTKELEVISVKEEELKRQRDFEESEIAGAVIVRDNFKKFLTQRL
jgi:hypothetical protein